jgi:hypothetical protein
MSIKHVLKALHKGSGSNHIISDYNLVIESLYLHLMAGRLAPASEVTGGHTLPF